jgi:CDP-diacylglycerol pyrophosphatase
MTVRLPLASRRRGAGVRLAACLGLLLAAAMLQACASTLVPGQSSALWVLVDARCNAGWAPIPFLQCRPERGEALLRDRCGKTRYLLIPTARRTGVESAELLRDDEPNYFADAWEARAQVVAASGRPAAGSDELGMAINSRWGRSQDQLHIHVDFVRPQVREAIKRWELEGASRPTIALFGHDYRIVHVEDLGPPTLFQQAAAPGDSQQQRELNTIAALGDGGSGFYVLFGRAERGGRNPGHGEEILTPRPCSG